jgi:hypothetical protein
MGTFLLSLDLPAHSIVRTINFFFNFLLPVFYNFRNIYSHKIRHISICRHNVTLRCYCLYHLLQLTLLFVPLHSLILYCNITIVMRCLMFCYQYGKLDVFSLDEILFYSRRIFYFLSSFLSSFIFLVYFVITLYSIRLLLV